MENSGGKPIITGGERGIGPATAEYLQKMGVKTLEFIRLPEKTVQQWLTKPGVEIWQELRGESVCPVLAEEKSVYASISMTKTFAPPTVDREASTRSTWAARTSSRPGEKDAGGHPPSANRRCSSARPGANT